MSATPSPEDGVLGRGALLGIALAVSGTLMAYPRILGARLGPLEHTALLVLLLGVSAAFVSGFGYRPDNRLARIVLSPAAAWLMLMGGAVLLA